MGKEAQPLPAGFHDFGGMKIGMVETRKLVRRRTNYRAMTDAERAALKNSVEKFGFKSFIVVAPGKDKGTFEVVDGHHRWQTAQDLKMEQVPVVMLEQDANGTDLAMLSFNVQADVIPDVYVDFLQELNARVGSQTLAAFTGIDDNFLADLGRTLEQVKVGEISLGSDAEEDVGADRSRGAAVHLSLPSTDEVNALLQQMQTAFKMPTPSDAVLAALRFLRDSWTANKEKKA